jgi:hypothetical protein
MNLDDINYSSEILMSRLSGLVEESFINDIELVLDLTQCDDGSTKCGYYFVNHASRSLFWLDDFDARCICTIPIVSFSHLGRVPAEQFCIFFIFDCHFVQDMKSKLNTGIDDLKLGLCS